MSLYLVSGIIGLLVVLISYKFISHTLQQRRIQRQRLITALKTRQRNFQYMVTGFPPGFLPAELGAQVYRALLTTTEELARLEPDSETHRADIALYNAELTASKQPAAVERVRLEHPEQIKEVRQNLQELHRFILTQEAGKHLNPGQAVALVEQIKRLVLQTTIDGYSLLARQAQQAGKPRLAIHNLTLAQKALIAENLDHQYDRLIAKIEQRIQALGQQAAAPQPRETLDETPLANKEWEHFEEEESNWKKKQIYD